MSLSIIHTEQGGFYDATGTRRTYCGFNFFPALERFIHGQDIDAMLDQWGDILAEIRAQAAHTGDGAWILPVVRVAGMGEKSDNTVMTLYPQNEPTFYTSIRAFADYLAWGLNGRWGFYTDLDVFLNAQLVMPNVCDRQRHWQRVGEAFAGCPSIFLSCGNEWRKNGFDPQEFSAPPADILWSRGSGLSGDDPPNPNGARYAKYHGKRGGTKGDLTGSDPLYAKRGYAAESAGGHSYGGNPGIPVILEETAKINDVASGSDLTGVDGTRAFYWFGVDSARCGGGTFHSHGGQFGEPLGPVQIAAGKGFVMGISKADPVQQEHA